MVRTQINKNGSTTIWNNEGKIHKGMHITNVRVSASPEHLARLNKIRDLYRMSDIERYRYLEAKFSIPLPTGGTGYPTEHDRSTNIQEEET